MFLRRWVSAALLFASGVAAAEPDVGGAVHTVTLRSLGVAKQFPLEAPSEVERKKHGEKQRCEKHHVEMKPVLITTFGVAGDPAVWRAYPLVVDAWECPFSDHFELPALLTAQEVKDVIAQGIGFAQKGDLDAAEASFRRVLSSSPTSVTSRMNLGSVYVDRIAKAEAEGQKPAALTHEYAIAIEQFERALAQGVSASTAKLIRGRLGSLYARSGRKDKARPLFEDLLADPNLPADQRAQIQRLLHD